MIEITTTTIALWRTRVGFVSFQKSFSRQRVPINVIPDNSSPGKRCNNNYDGVIIIILLLSNTTYLGGGGDVFLTTSAAAADIRDNDDETVRLREIRLKAAARRGE